MTSALCEWPLATLYSASTSWTKNEAKEYLRGIRRVHTALVFSIICRPYAVTLDEMARQGSFPIVAPVKPYTELALIWIK